MIRPGCDAYVSARPDHAMLRGLVAFQLELTPSCTKSCTPQQVVTMAAKSYRQMRMSQPAHQARARSTQLPSPGIDAGRSPRSPRPRRSFISFGVRPTDLPRSVNRQAPRMPRVVVQAGRVLALCAAGRTTPPFRPLTVRSRPVGRASPSPTLFRRIHAYSVTDWPRHCPSAEG